MKKTMNKKGFTLVELLAVIVILAVIILVAMNAVIPQMQKARKNAFITEAERYLQAAKTYYTGEAIKGAVTDTCVNVEELTGTYVEKTGADDYKGRVEFDAAGTTFTIFISNGEFSINGDDKGKTLEQLSSEGEGAIDTTYSEQSACS